MLAHRVAYRFRFGNAGWADLTGGDRVGFIDSVWDMYKESYAKLGLHLPSPQALLKYDVWAVYGGDTPKAFVCWSREPFGLKAGVLGSDGTSDGKGAILDYFPDVIRHPGHYAEVSHTVERLTMKAPVVCAAYVSEIVGKPVEPSADGVHYTRSIANVGKVEKILVGNPRGYPTTNRRNPDCPIQSPTPENAKVAHTGTDPERDLADHIACQWA